MEFNIIHGKKSTSKIYHVFEEEQVYVQKNAKSEILMYVKCYFKNCSVTEKIQNGKFSHVKHAIHNDHTQSIPNLIAEWKFFDELRKQSAISRNPLKIVFDEVYQR